MFTVIAGKYEGQEESIKYTAEHESLDKAIADADQHRSYPFCYIEYEGRRLTLVD